MAVTLTDDQKHAIETRGGTVLVSAAAGSGKTYVLTQRIVHMVTDETSRCTIDQILACTFSEAAAAEMKVRIDKAIADAISEHPDDRVLRQQQVLLSSAQISTVHSFCLKLLREFFHLADLDPTFQIASEEEANLLKQEALQDALEESYRSDSDGSFAQAADLLSAHTNDDQLAEDVLSLYHLLSSCPYPDEWLDEKEALYLSPPSEEDSPIWAEAFREVSSDFRLYRQALESSLDDALQDGMMDGYAKTLASDLHLLDRVLKAAEQKDGTALYQCLSNPAFDRLGSCKKEADPVLKEEIKARRNAVKKAIQSWSGLICASPEMTNRELLEKAPAVSAFFAAVRRFKDRYDELKKEKRLLDFSDLEHKTLSLLTEKDGKGGHQPTALAAMISQRYAEILLDEYQDINGVQEEIFKAISKNGENLFMVGDLKQGIYRFRLADPTLFAHKKENFALYDGVHFPAKIILGRNFRSRRQVTGFINTIFERIMTKRTGELNYGPEDALVPEDHFTFQPEQTPIHLTILDAENTEEAEEKQANFIAGKIRSMLDSGYPVQNKDGSVRPCRPGDFAILLRSVKGRGQIYLKALSRQNIETVTNTGDAFFETKEISGLLSLLQAIDNPLLDLPLAAALCGPVFDFSADDLTRITAHDTSYLHKQRPLYLRLLHYAESGENASLKERCQKVVSALQRWRQTASSKRSDEMLRSILDETHFTELMQVQKNGAERVARIRQLLALASLREKSRFLGLSGFVRLLNDWQEKKIQPKNDFTFSADDCVTLLSIHKSKGLEFPVVFVADLQKKFNFADTFAPTIYHADFGFCMQGRTPLDRQTYPTLPHSIAAHNSQMMQRSEEIRILYVALTRAKEALFLVAAGKNICTSVNNGLEKARLFADWPQFSVLSATNYLSMLLTALSPDCPEFLPDPAEGEVLCESPSCSFTLEFQQQPITPEAAEEAEDQAVLPPADPAFVEAIKAHLAYRYPHPVDISAPVKQSISHLQKHLEEELPSTDLETPSFLEPGKQTGAQRGTACHLLLEKADFQRARENPEAELARLLSAGYLTESEQASVPKDHILTFFASPFLAHVLEENKLWKEQPLLFSLPLSVIDPSLCSDEPAVLQGVADCIYQTKDGLGILDYKTDRNKTPEELKKEYTKQLQLYALGASFLMEQPVTELYLYALELDREIPVPLPDFNNQTR